MQHSWRDGWGEQVASVRFFAPLYDSMKNRRSCPPWPPTKENLQQVARGLVGGRCPSSFQHVLEKTLDWQRLPALEGVAKGAVADEKNGKVEMKSRCVPWSLGAYGRSVVKFQCNSSSARKWYFAHEGEKKKGAAPLRYSNRACSSIDSVSTAGDMCSRTLT